jgi:hypothetical protein
MFKFLSNWFRNIFLSMKAGEKMMSTENTNDSTISVTQTISKNKLADDLLKEKITQDVEMLRYSMYKIDEKVNDYHVNLDGTTVKKNKPKVINGKHKFNILNKKLTAGIADELNRLDEYDNEKFTMDIQTEYITRFKIEKYISSVDVDIDDSKNIKKTSLHFSTIPNVYDGNSMPFINELKKLKDLPLDNEYAVSRNEIASSMLTLSFVCLKVDEEYDFTNYSFLNPKLVDVKEVDTEIILTFEWEEYMRKALNLSEKYYSEEREKQYQNNEAKETSKNLRAVLRVVKCSVCGKVCQMDGNEAKIFDNGQVICNDCLKKQENNN